MLSSGGTWLFISYLITEINKHKVKKKTRGQEQSLAHEKKKKKNVVGINLLRGLHFFEDRLVGFFIEGELLTQGQSAVKTHNFAAPLKAIVLAVPVREHFMDRAVFQVFFQKNIDFQSLKLWTAQELSGSRLVRIIIVQDTARQNVVMLANSSPVALVKAQKFPVKGGVQTNGGGLLFRSGH